MQARPYIILTFSLLVFLLSCSPKNNRTAASMASGKIKVYSPVYPILIGKQYNPVLQIAVDAIDTTQVVNLEKLVISLDGTDKLEDILSIQIFYTGNQPEFSTDQLFAKTESVFNSLQLSGKQALAYQKNYFWLSITLNNNANLAHTINATCHQVTINGKAESVPQSGTYKPKRIGHALRKHLDDGVHTYRIPGMITTNKGTLIGVYDIRRNGPVDLQEDIDIGMNRSTDGGQSWEPMKVIMDMGEWGGKPQGENGIGDPAILYDNQTNTIWVAAIWAHGHPGKRNWHASKPGIKPTLTSQLMLSKSEDDGLTWSAPINLTPMIKDPKWHLLLQGPGRGITMEDGTLVFPAQYKDENKMPHSTLLSSKDHGQTWQLGTGAKSNTTESQVVELSDGSLMLNMRDNRGNGPNGKTGKGTRSIAITKDLGKTWIAHPTSQKALIEPVCNAGLLKHHYQGKDLLVFINPHDQYVRKNMTIKISEDEGMTWPEKYYTLIDEGRGRGYPSLTSIDENTIGFLYEGSQADLVFQKFNVKELLKID